MFIGWGEGLDEAARYLNDTIDTATAKVFPVPAGRSATITTASPTRTGTWNADYSVIYAHQWQRVIALAAHDAPLQPAHPRKDRHHRRSIEFVRICDMAAHPTPITQDFGGAIRLVYYDTYSGVMPLAKNTT